MKIFAPVSIGNFSVGFDLLGLAITPVNGEILGDIVSIKKADNFALTYEGPYADILPQDKSLNLVTLAYNKYMQTMASKNQETSAVAMHLYKRLPVGSGLGSSSSSTVAALYALNQFFEDALSVDELLELAGQLEGEVSGTVHYDNVAPCLLGGLQLITDYKPQPCISIPFPQNWQIIISYPGVKVSTKKARKLLPETNDLATSIKYAQNLAVFIQALNNGDENMAAAVLFDVIAEPSRKKLIPNFNSYKDYAKTVGALAFGISGSGSTVFSISNNHEISNKIQKYAISNFCNEKGFSYICKVDNYGVREIHEF